MDMRRKDAKELLSRIRERFKTMQDADLENRESAMADMEFVNVPGAQWDANMKIERGQRPCLEFNKLRVSCKRIINDMRANRPQGKVRAVEGGDKEVAEIYEGLVRNIWNVSDADTVVDYAGEYQVAGGMGAWRINTQYSSDTAFDQDIVIEPIQNPFCLYADPAAQDYLKRDAEDWILTDRITHKAFEARYGKKAEKVDFESTQFDDDDQWMDEETVRVAEYWWREPVTKEIWMMQFPNEDGTVETKVVEADSDEGVAIAQQPELQQLIVRRREVETYQIKSVVASGERILEGPTDWAGHHFPFVMVYGEMMVIDGKLRWWGLTRFAKDAQRAYNYSRTAITETIAQAPKSFFWATPEQAKGFEDLWAVAHKKALPWMPYNSDPKAPGPPNRMGGADVPIALIQESQIASDEIKAVTGIFDASLGMRSNEQSGRAIYARQQQGEIATFNYQDNMAKAIRRTYELVIDLIPQIYDTERELRVIGSDGAEDYHRVNQVVQDPSTGRVIRVNDLSAGKYDVTITVGPNFSTLRQEAAEIYGQIAQQFPEMMQIAGDLVFKSMDLPYAEDIAERLRLMLPPQVQEMINQGGSVPAEVQQAMQQAAMAMQQAQQHGQLVQAAAAELEEEKSLNEKQKSEIREEIAKLEVKKAQFDVHVQKALTKLVTEQADIEKVMRDIAPELEQYDEVVGVKEDLSNVSQTINTIDDLLANFMESVDEAVERINAKADRRVVGGQTRRVDGKLIADVQYDDGTTRSIAAVRDRGNLRIVPEE